MFNTYLFYCEINFTIITVKCFVSLVSKNSLNFGRRHFKLFTNCHISCTTTEYSRAEIRNVELEFWNRNLQYQPQYNLNISH